MNDILLRTSLLDLFHLLGANAHGILLGGGYGLYIKQLHLMDSMQPTLIPLELWPAARATQDLDLFLSVELVSDANAMSVIRNTLDRLGYEVIEGSEYMQFVRAITDARAVKIDLLTAQLDVLKADTRIHADDRRARPTAPDRPRLHAHPTDGALSLMKSPLAIDVEGKLSDGQASTAKVLVPHPFNYVLMKLTAYRDRRDDPDKEHGSHHALDIFRIVAMLSETERDEVIENMRIFENNQQVLSCADLVRSDFHHAASPGALAIRQHPLWRNDKQIDAFLETLKEITLA